MDTAARKWNVKNATISIGIVACLCFSIGEGLRLTPFPVTVLSEIEEGFNDTGNSLQRYGPIDVPARAQLRNKRHVVDYAFLTPQRAFASTPVINSGYHETPDMHMIYSGSPPIGRAPPAC